MSDQKKNVTRSRWRRLPKLSRRTWLIGGGVIVAGIVVVVLGWWLLAGNGSNENSADNQNLELAEVVVTDLAQAETFGGTLGFEAGDPITSRLNGTLTGVMEAGSVATEGQTASIVIW